MDRLAWRRVALIWVPHVGQTLTWRPGLEELTWRPGLEELTWRPGLEELTWRPGLEELTWRPGLQTRQEKGPGPFSSMPGALDEALGVKCGHAP